MASSKLSIMIHEALAGSAREQQAASFVGDPLSSSSTRSCCYSGNAEPLFLLGQQVKVVASREDERTTEAVAFWFVLDNPN